METVVMILFGVLLFNNLDRLSQCESSLCHRGSSSYCGLTASDWTKVIGRGKIVLSGYTSKTGRFVVWNPEPGFWQTVAHQLEWGQSATQSSLPLLEGDPEAVGVLIELLDSPDPMVQRIAIQGLKNVGPRARAAIPALLSRQRDANTDVQKDARDALRYIQQEEK